MTVLEANDLLAPPAPLRALRSDETPYPGMLCGTDPPTVCVAEADLPEVVWSLTPGGHLLAPVEVQRMPDGVAALVPHCPHRLSAHLGAPTTGQAVTVAVSILRAVRECAEADEERGGWWVDGTGRPVLALGVGNRWRDDAIALLTEMDETTPSLPLAAAIAVVADSDATLRQTEAAEDALFAVAQPQPLSDPPQNGTAAPDVSARPLRRAPREVAGWLETWLDANLAGRVGESLAGSLDALRRAGARAAAAVRPFRARTSVRGEVSLRQAKERAPRRRGPWLAAAAVAGMVIAGGTLWPEDAADGRPPEAAAPATEPGPPPASETGGVDDGAIPAEQHAPSGEAGDPLAAATRAALTALRRCLDGDEQSCALARERADSPDPGGLAADPDAIETISVLDEYGGVAVMRVESAKHAAQAVVLVSVGDRWLVREVYDLAHQP